MVKDMLNLSDYERPKTAMQTAHYAAELESLELGRWNPLTFSADAEWLPEREQIIARTQDSVRNNGMVSGAIQTQVDNLVGSGLRLAAKPMWDILGVKDPKTQREWEAMAESLFSEWADDPIHCFCDASEQLTFGGLVAQAARVHATTFDVTAVAEWLPNRPGAKYATAIQMVDPLRLCNKDMAMDDERLRAGIVFNERGVPVRYQFANRIPTEPFTFRREPVLRWTEVDRWTPWGRQQVIHLFDQERPGQSRGKGGIVTVLARGLMLNKNEQAHLQAAIQNAMYATVITSPMEWNQVGAALGTGDANKQVKDYLANRLAFHKAAMINYAGTKIAHLYPGEELNHVAAEHPHANFEEFERVFHRYMAAGMNMTYEQFSRDYSQTNYSGHRAALLDYFRFVTGRRAVIPGRFATMGYALWLEEAMDSGRLPAPPGTPTFYEAKAAWCNCDWIGPGRGQIDPLKEANADKVELSMGLTTLEIAAAERGRDWRKLQEQRAQELAHAIELENRLKLPPGSLSNPAGPTPVPQPPDAPEVVERRPAR